MPLELANDRPTASVQAPWRGPFWLALSIAILAFATFGPIYVLRTARDDPNLTWFVQLHGLLMFAWIAFVVVQTALINRRNVQLHRRWGLAGVPLAIAMAATGLLVLTHAAKRQADGDPTRFRLMLVAFDGVNLLVFLALVLAAVFWRRRSDIHRRLILLATLCLLGPAFGRLTSIVSGFGQDNDAVVLLLMMSCLVAFAAVDFYRNRRLHLATVLGIAAIASADLMTYGAKLAL